MQVFFPTYESYDKMMNPGRGGLLARKAELLAEQNAAIANKLSPPPTGTKTVGDDTPKPDGSKCGTCGAALITKREPWQPRGMGKVVCPGGCEPPAYAHRELRERHDR